MRVPSRPRDIELLKSSECVNKNCKKKHPKMMVRIRHILVVFCAIFAPITAAGKWFHKNDKHYFFSSVQTTWNDAQSNCNIYGAKLVTIDNAKENKYLLRRNPVDERRSGMTAHWIGLKGFCPPHSGCSWRWDDGTEVDESALLWATGYPESDQFQTYAYLGKCGGTSFGSMLTIWVSAQVNETVTVTNSGKFPF